MVEGDADPDNLPLGFNVIMRSDVWPTGEGVVHNDEDRCRNAPESGVRTDLHTAPGDNKKLCYDCEWPDGAEAALNLNESIGSRSGGESGGEERAGDVPLAGGERREIRPLTASEWHGLLADTDYVLRVSDGTKEGSWYFWCEQHHDEGSAAWLYARRFIWHDDREVGTSKLAEALEGDTTTQVVVRETVRNEPPEGGDRDA